MSKVTFPRSPLYTAKMMFPNNFVPNKRPPTLFSNQLGRTTKYIYDLAGQLSSVTYAYGTVDAGTMTYTYDDPGRQGGEQKRSKTNSNNTTTNYDDAAGRLTRRARVFSADRRRTQLHAVTRRG